MLKYNLKIAWRSLLNNKAYSAINVAGLSLGMCACLLILHYVSYEFSFDRFHEKGEQIYRIRNDRQDVGGLTQKVVATYPFVGQALKKEFSEVEDFVRVSPWMAEHTVFQYGDKIFREKAFHFAEASFFDIFSFGLLQGDPKTALKEPM
jgi:putative ABC transport system permease protein